MRILSIGIRFQGCIGRCQGILNVFNLAQGVCGFVFYVTPKVEIFMIYDMMFRSQRCDLLLAMK